MYSCLDILHERKADNNHLEDSCMKSPFLSPGTWPWHRHPMGSPLGGGSLESFLGVLSCQHCPSVRVLLQSVYLLI